MPTARLPIPLTAPSAAALTVATSFESRTTAAESSLPLASPDALPSKNKSLSNNSVSNPFLKYVDETLTLTPLSKLAIILA